MCDVTHSHVWHDSFSCVTWLILMYYITHSPDACWGSLMGMESISKESILWGVESVTVWRKFVCGCEHPEKTPTPARTNDEGCKSARMKNASIETLCAQHIFRCIHVCITFKYIHIYSTYASHVQHTFISHWIGQIRLCWMCDFTPTHSSHARILPTRKTCSDYYMYVCTHLCAYCVSLLCVRVCMYVYLWGHWIV